RPAKLHEAGIEIFSAMYNTDFAKENNLLAALDLENYSLEDLQHASLSGILN
ncbi:MAG: NAD/NADP octopine/nopaline dehydrogenase, partial [Deltaproteobacteria bacterium]|nr:NAD/NADP octopine/nopaline dehydrogenase [Deltaproteobacteria bacterium]